MLLLLLALVAQDRPVLPAPDDGSAPAAAVQPADPGEEVIVRGDRDMSRFRIGPAGDGRWAEKPIRPNFAVRGLGNVSVEGEQRTLPGASAPAAMVRLRIPLGRKAAAKK